MKLYTKAIALCAFAALPMGAAIAAPTTAPQNVVTEADTKTFTLNVSGMKWAGSCAKKVQSALTKVKGVSKVVVTMPNKAVVQAKSGVSAQDLIKAVKAAGFTATEKAMKES